LDWASPGRLGVAMMKGRTSAPATIRTSSSWIAAFHTLYPHLGDAAAAVEGRGSCGGSSPKSWAQLVTLAGRLSRSSRPLSYHTGMESLDQSSDVSACSLIDRSPKSRLVVSSRTPRRICPPILLGRGHELPLKRHQSRQGVSSSQTISTSYNRRLLLFILLFT
jgi:hypothetical protein